MTTAAAFDRGAAKYDRMIGLNPGYHRELRRAAAALVERTRTRPPQGRQEGSLSFIDLACGSGASTRALLAAAPGTDVAGGSLTVSGGVAPEWVDATAVTVQHSPTHFSLVPAEAAS